MLDRWLISLMFCGFNMLKMFRLTTVWLLLKQLWQSDRDGDSFTETVVTAGADRWETCITVTEALTASVCGALQRHLVEAAGKHEGSHCKIKWKHLCKYYLISKRFFTWFITFERTASIVLRQIEATQMGKIPLKVEYVLK